MPAAGNQANVEYFFRLLYDCILYTCGAAGGWAAILSFFAHLWVWITIIGYLVAFAGLALIVYCLMRLYALRHEEEEHFSTIHIAKDEHPHNARWAHIQSLMVSDSPSAWREAIIEADIMLGDLLSRQGYPGATIADQLKQVERGDLATLEDAWEAHRVRNQIAHEGSSFDLSRILAQRTISRFEQVFSEFGVI